MKFVNKGLQKKIKKFLLFTWDIRITDNIIAQEDFIK